MQKSTKVIESLIKEASVEKNSINSYVQLVKVLSDVDSYSPDQLLDLLNIAAFNEDSETTYRSYPIKISYKQIPVVTGGEVLMKVVVLTQADSYAVIVPEHISEIYKELTENPDLLVEKNIGLSLYAELYGFDSEDKELLELIKESYLIAGNALAAFELTGDLKLKSSNNSEEEQDELYDSDMPSPTFDVSADASSPSFSAIEEPVESFPELEENIKPLKKFKKQGNFLEALVKKLYSISNDAFKENIKIKYLNKNKNVLLVEVNNKNIYKKFEHVPLVAKKALSAFGESIRKDGKTQLVDAFTKDGKRYFVVAESAGNNFWYVNKEEVKPLIENTDIIKPIQKDIIKLVKSSIRQESRKFLPHKENKEIVFSKK